jgi:type I restriction enzyme M protein
MITGPLKNRIDRLWDEFWTGGISNPLTVIEQITFLMFIRMLDITETRRQKQAERNKKDFKSSFRSDQQHLRWQSLMKLGGEQLLKTVRDEVFPHLRDLAGTESTFGKHMQDATFMIQKAALLVRAM